ncbi:MAG: 16S rRNA (adenine(1518)-N(6)/adenine(1519)-N(6))-dimethyltransferase RsmA [Dermatophilaceae bacterium]
MSDERDGAKEAVLPLGASAIRALAAQVGLRPAKSWGQNFVVDANTVRRIARLAQVGPDDVVLEVGPGLGSLTLALLERGARVTAVEIDPVLAELLPRTVAERTHLVPQTLADRLRVVQADAMRVAEPSARGGDHVSEPGHARETRGLVELPGPSATALVANLPYNVAVPVLLTLLGRLPALRRALVMVQWEVAERLAAPPGDSAYGIPSVKVAWYGTARLAGSVPRAVFWPTPRVDSGLVEIVRGDPPATTATREEVFACVDAAFAQRRKTLRAALASWAGGAARAEETLRAAGVDPSARGERLSVHDFARIAAAAARSSTPVDTPADPGTW